MSQTTDYKVNCHELYLKGWVPGEANADVLVKRIKGDEFHIRKLLSATGLASSVLRMPMIPGSAEYGPHDGVDVFIDEFGGITGNDGNRLSQAFFDQWIEDCKDVPKVLEKQDCKYAIRTLRDFLENHWDRKFTTFWNVVKAYRAHIGEANAVYGQRQELVNDAIIYAFIMENKLEPADPVDELPMENFTHQFKNELDAAFYPN